MRSDFYLQPFEEELWRAIALIFAIGSILTLLVEKFLKSKNRSLVDNVFLVFELFCSQTGNEEMETISLRIVGLSMGIIGMVIVNSFGAVITSFIAVHNFEIPFTNLDQFLENGQYKLMTDDLDFMYNYLKVLTNLVNFMGTCFKLYFFP